MHSYRVLGIIALGAIVIAVASFTVVDISIASANGCLAAAHCVQSRVPWSAIVSASIGCIALLVAILPAIGWITGMLRRPLPSDFPLPHDLPLPPVPRAVLEDEL